MTVLDLFTRFGPMPLARIRFTPSPGTATKQDVLDIWARERRLCELVDGILVEKAVGFRESVLAAVLIGFLRAFLSAHRTGTSPGTAFRAGRSPPSPSRNWPRTLPSRC